jgi:malonate transporter and related proteins
MNHAGYLFTLLAPFFTVIGVGFVCGWKMRTRHPETGLAWLQFFLIYVALPPLFFKLIADKPFEQLLHGRYIVATTTSTVLMFTLCFALALIAKNQKREAGMPDAVMQSVAGSYSNVVYMGPPLIFGAFGAGAAIPVALIIVFDNLFLFIVTPLLMTFFEAGEKRVFSTFKSIIWRVSTHPFNVATALGLYASYAQLTPPVWLGHMFTNLANAAPPCALFLLGVTLALRPATRPPVEVAWILPIKLVLHPLAVWFMLSLIGAFDPVWVYTAMMMAALPPALNVFVMATHYQTGVDRASASVLLGTCFSVATLSLWLILIQMGYVGYDLFP